MPRRSKRLVFLSEFGDAVVSHHVFADVHKLMCEDSDVDSEDEEVVSTKVIAAAQYAALMNFRYIFRASSYRADVRGRRMGYPMPEWKKIVLGYKYNEEEFLKIYLLFGRQLIVAFFV
jgi:hypothetical protein